MIAIRTLGPVEVLVDGRPAPPELLWRKHLALLVYLARSPGNGRSREHLTGLLWGEKPDSAARHSLNEGLRIIRRCLGDGALDAAGGQVRIQSDSFTIDTAEFEASAERADWEAAAALVSGEFMEGFAVAGEWGFEEWLAVERTHWKRQSVHALVRHAESRFAAGDAAGAARAASHALRLEPANEAACRTIMRTRALLGDRTGALAAYEEFATRLRDEIGIEPSTETSALAVRIGNEREVRAPAHLAGRPQTGAESRRAPLVERDVELAGLVREYHACRSGGGARLAIIEADPGCGRTRVLQETVDRARLDGSLTAVLRAVEGDRQARWSGIAGLLRSGLATAEGVDDVPPGARIALARLLSPGHDEEGPEDAPDRAAAFSELLRALAARQPTVLAVDDAHWLDHDSLLTLGTALRDLAAGPLFVVLSVATHEAVAEIDELRARMGRDLRGHLVRLRPLTGTGLRTLADWALPAFEGIEIDRVTRRLASDTAGLPLLVLELLHAIALGLDLAPEGSIWPAPLRTLDHTMPGDLPDTITAAIRVGYRRLSENARTVLAAASVLDVRVEPDVLERATSLPSTALSDALDELEWSRWLHAEARGYSFVARIVRQVVARDMVTSGQRRRIQKAARAT